MCHQGMEGCALVILGGEHMFDTCCASCEQEIQKRYYRAIMDKNLAYFAVKGTYVHTCSSYQS